MDAPTGRAASPTVPMSDRAACRQDRTAHLCCGSSLDEVCPRRLSEFSSLTPPPCARYRRPALNPARNRNRGGAVNSRSTQAAPPMTRFRAAWFVSVVALALCTLPAPMVPPAAAQAPGTLVLGLDQEPPTLDPHASPSAVTYQIIASVTENLVYKGPDGKLQPWLAESWTPSKDGSGVTLKLRRAAAFHDEVDRV